MTITAKKERDETKAAIWQSLAGHVARLAATIA
jgi:hypothetical protein